MLTRTPPTSLLCGMSRDWIFITSGKPTRAIAASSPSRSVTSTSSGKRDAGVAQQRLAVGIRTASRDVRCADRSRGGSSAASAGGASLNLA